MDIFWNYTFDMDVHLGNAAMFGFSTPSLAHEQVYVL